MPTNVLAIGAGSFIASQWRTISSHVHHHVSRHGVTGDNVRHVDVIVNCATSPEFKTGPYDETLDFDLKAARLAASRNAHFVMLSTRKVYAPSSTIVRLDESSSLGPVDHYGSNKLESEHRIQTLLGNRCTILRIANVFGFELGRQSFFGLALSRLKSESQIVLDVSPFTSRDFIPAALFGYVLDRICDQRPGGIINVGSGNALQLGRIAQWLIQGYGAGTLKVVDITERDAFVMVIDKLRNVIGDFASHDNLESNIKSIGKKLKDE